MLIQPRVDPLVYLAFKRLAHSHGLTVERLIEEAMRTTLERAGIRIEDETTKCEQANTVT